MSSWARPGVKCVCIKRGAWTTPDNTVPQYENTRPVFGGTYTIRDVSLGKGGGVYLRFEEIVNPLHRYRDGMLEVKFNAANFRPLITRTQEDDVRLIKSLLVGDEVDA